MRQRIAVGTLWNGVVMILSRCSALLTSIVVARRLGVEKFGAFGFIQSTILVASALGAFGYGATATKYVAEFRAASGDRLGKILGCIILAPTHFSAGLSIALYFFAPWVTENLLAAPRFNQSSSTWHRLLIYWSPTRQ